MGAKVKKAQYVCRMPLKRILNSDDVAQGLGHLLAVYGQKSIVDPDLGEFLARSLRLRQLVFMMRENQVLPTSMDVEGFP